jgi:hypothetical protein
LWGDPLGIRSPANRSPRMLPEHSTLAPARQQHDEGHTRPQPHRSLNREVHIVLLSFMSFMIACGGIPRVGDRKL